MVGHPYLGITSRLLVTQNRCQVRRLLPTSRRSYNLQRAGPDYFRIGDCTGVQGFAATLCYHSTGEYIALAQFMGCYDARGEDYSQRNATMGSTFEARRAGM